MNVRKVTESILEEMITLRMSGKTYSEIGNVKGFSPTAVGRHMRKNGVSFERPKVNIERVRRHKMIAKCCRTMRAKDICKKFNVSPSVVSCAKYKYPELSGSTKGKSSPIAIHTQRLPVFMSHMPHALGLT